MGAGRSEPRIDTVHGTRRRRPGRDDSTGRLTDLSDPDVATVFVAALVTAMATGLGALPLLVARSRGRFVLGTSNAIAAGVMLAASVSLSLEGVARSPWRTAVGGALGVCFVLVTERYLEHDHGHRMGSLRGTTRGGPCWSSAS